MISVQINSDEISKIEQHPVLASIVIALGVFLLTQIFAFAYNAITTRIKRKKIRKMAEINLRMVSGYLFNKCVHFRVASEAKNIHDVPFLIFGSFPSDILKEIGYQNLYDAYFGGFGFKSKPPEKYKQFNFIWTLVLSVPLIETDIKALTEKITNEYFDAQKEQLRHAGVFLTKIDRLRVDRFHKKLSKEEMLYLDGQEIIQAPWTNQPAKFSPEILHNGLVMPSLEHLRANLPFEFAPELSDSLIAAYERHDHWVKLHKNYSDRAFENYRLYEQDYQNFNIALKAFDIDPEIDIADYNNTYAKQ